MSEEPPTLDEQVEAKVRDVIERFGVEIAKLRSWRYTDVDVLLVEIRLKKRPDPQLCFCFSMVGLYGDMARYIETILEFSRRRLEAFERDGTPFDSAVDDGRISP